MGYWTGGRNPALDKAFPHGTVEIPLSPRGLDFGGSWGAWEGSLWGSPGYGFGGANEGRLGRLEARIAPGVASPGSEFQLHGASIALL